MAVRFLHLADTHIGARHPARCGGDPFTENLRRALAPARRGEAELVLHGGDLFHRSRPPPRALAAAAGELVDAAEGGARVVIVPGNHERSLVPARLLLGHPRITVVEGPTALPLDLDGLEVSVFAFPFLRRDARGRFEAVLRTAGWPRARRAVNLLLCHQTFAGATVGPSGYTFRGGPDVVPREWVPTGFCYAALGHIHRHQVLAHPDPDGPALAYPGSTERTSRAERFEEKGYLRGELLEGRDVRFAFARLPSVPLRTAPPSPPTRSGRSR
jgi:exonuclease SbcD